MNYEQFRFVISIFHVKIIISIFGSYNIKYIVSWVNNGMSTTVIRRSLLMHARRSALTHIPISFNNNNKNDTRNNGD